MTSSTYRVSEPLWLLVMLRRKEDGIDDDTRGDEGFKAPMGDKWVQIQLDPIQNLLPFAYWTMELSLCVQTKTD